MGTNYDKMGEITMEDLGNYIIELNKPYDEDMKKYIDFTYVTNSYKYNVT